MIQKEVAERLIAKPGEKLAGAITYTVYYYCDSEKILEVPNSSFIPEPEVTSEVIKMNLRKEPAVQVKDNQKLFAIIKAAFMQRRKTLLNSLTNGQIFSSKQKALEVFEKLNINQNARAEELTLEKFAEITDYIIENKDCK